MPHLVTFHLFTFWSRITICTFRVFFTLEIYDSFETYIWELIKNTILDKLVITMWIMRKKVFLYRQTGKIINGITNIREKKRNWLQFITYFICIHCGFEHRTSKGEN